MKRFAFLFLLAAGCHHAAPAGPYGVGAGGDNASGTNTNGNGTGNNNDDALRWLSSALPYARWVGRKGEVIPLYDPTSNQPTGQTLDTSPKYEDLPAEVVHKAKGLILDTVGCAFGGYDSEPAKIARDMAATVTSTRPATILATADGPPSCAAIPCTDGDPTGRHTPS